MKAILSIIMVLIFASCSKESAQTCFTCTYATTQGVQKPSDVRCTDGEQPPVTYDNAGNPIGQQCIKR